MRSLAVRRSCFVATARAQAWCRAIDSGEVHATLKALNRVKAGDAPPHPDGDDGVDYCRALCFLRLGCSGAMLHARQALLEELRRCPAHQPARALLWKMNQQLRPLLLPPAIICRAEPLFALLCDALLDHTMLSWPRLLHLYRCARRLCAEGVRSPGHIVECGTAAGGSAVMMAVAIAEAESRGGGGAGATRCRVFALDSFAGMPPPTSHDAVAEDQDRGSSSSETTQKPELPPLSSSWSTGTCSAAAAHVQQLAANFGVENYLITVPGLFAQSIPSVLLTHPLVQREGIALLHADADWYASTRDVLGQLVPVMRATGRSGVQNVPKVVQVDDYYHWPGCRRAVDELLDHWAAQDGWRPLLHAIDQNAVYFEV